ncbi:MAG: diguanylate cyclase [Oscillospiraceae bacterium]|nr:diguanylate cyclase [Oscillospiraceae bacterium]
MKNILIVDDNKINLTAAKNALNDVYKVTAVISGEQALRFLSSNTPDLILLDINMPEMDGYEVLEKIRQIDRLMYIPVVFLTADNDAQTESKCLEAGAVDFIAKPFVPIVMRSRISRVIELEELRKSLAVKLDEKIREVSDMKSRTSKDTLTGLWNRTYTEETVNFLLSEGIKGALFMIDMDNFKLINDKYGHIAGDNTLKMFADTMRNHSSEQDILCRIGGDEFIMFIRDVNEKKKLGDMAAGIINELTEKIKDTGYDTNTSVSIGISLSPVDGTEFSQLYNSADKSLYFVKQNGKGSFHFFSDQHLQEKERSENIVDIKFIRDLMTRSDANNGSYMLNFESFNNVYNFIRRFVERTNRMVQTILFTVNDENNDFSEIEAALESLEYAVFSSLRRVDVSTRYSSKQLIVILIDSDKEGGVSVAQRIISCFEGMCNKPNIHITYDIARMEGLSN